MLKAIFKMWLFVADRSTGIDKSPSLPSQKESIAGSTMHGGRNSWELTSQAIRKQREQTWNGAGLLNSQTPLQWHTSSAKATPSTSCPLPNRNINWGLSIQCQRLWGTCHSNHCNSHTADALPGPAVFLSVVCETHAKAGVTGRCEGTHSDCPVLDMFLGFGERLGTLNLGTSLICEHGWTAVQNHEVRSWVAGDTCSALVNGVDLSRIIMSACSPPARCQLLFILTRTWKLHFLSTRLFFLYLLTCRSSFYITDMALESYFVNIFSHSGACLFTHLVVSSDEKKALFFVYSNLSFYYIYFFNTFYTFSLHLNHEAVLGNFPPAYVYKQCGIDFYV